MEKKTSGLLGLAALGGLVWYGMKGQKPTPTPTPTPSAPVASFVASVYSGTAPLDVTFANLSTGTITAYQWTFGDGATSTEKNPTHRFATPNTYTVRLLVTGPDGSSSATAHITVSAAVIAPVALFTASVQSGIVPLTVQFTDKSTGTIEAYAWNFGDGGSSNEQNPLYTYPVAGNYLASLTVTGPLGSSTVEMDIAALLPVPAAPVLLSPGNPAPPGEWLANPVPASITFTWQPSEWAAGYILAVVNLTDAQVIYDSVALGELIPGTSKTLTGLIVQGKRYTWSVVAINAAGPSELGIPLYFNTQAGTPATLTLRPNGPGFYTQLQAVGALTNWECVAPEIVNTYRYVQFYDYAYTRDTYAIQDHSGQTGAIQKVRVCAVAYKAAGGLGMGEVLAQLCIRLGLLDLTSAEFTLAETPEFFSAEFPNPLGGVWSWADINALEAGFAERSPNYSVGKCCQLWVEVDYLL